MAFPYCNISYIDQIHRHFLLFPSTFLFLHFALWQCLVTSEEDKGKRNPHLPRTMLVFCLCLVFPSPLTNLNSPHTPMGSEFHSRHLRIPRCFFPYKNLPPPLPESPHFDFLAVQKPYQWISHFLPHPAIGLHFFIFYSAPYPLFLPSICSESLVHIFHAPLFLSCPRQAIRATTRSLELEFLSSGKEAVGKKSLHSISTAIGIGALGLSS